MTIAIISTIFASFLWGVTNHIDKFMITDIDKQNNIKILLVFSTFVAGIVLTPFWLIFSHFMIKISTISLISILASAIAYGIAALFYFKAMEKNDTSIVIAMFQLVPVFSYILALIIFKETLTIKQIIGSLIILLSTIIISIDFSTKNSNNKIKALILVTISSFLTALYYILFDIGLRNSSYNACSFWFQIGLLIIGIFLLCIKTYRLPFINTIKKNGKNFLTLNATNELINLLGIMLVNYSNLLIPVALVTILTGFQSIFAFILGLLGTILLPKYIKEDISKNVIIQKISCIILGIIGLIILVY